MATDVNLYNKLKKYKIAVVVPAYNEEMLIEITIRNIPQYVSKIYVIDDCSTDNTSIILSNIKDTRVVTVRNKKNMGVGGAVTTGYKLAISDGMDMVAVMAGDNQMDPEELPRLLMPIIEGKADYTKGNRLVNNKYRKGMSTWRSFGNYLLTFLNKLASGYWYIADPQNGYTVISTRALKDLNLDNIYKGFAFENDMLVKLNINDATVINIPIPARYGNESSKIRYVSFILKTSLYFIKAFFWRVWTKYFSRGIHPIGVLYISSIALIIIGLPIMFFWNYWPLLFSIILFIMAMAVEILRCKKLNETRVKNDNKFALYA